MWNRNNVQHTIYDLYKYATENNLDFLPSFTSAIDPLNSFWENFENNRELYERYFAKRYKSYRFYDQDVETDNPIADVYTDFYTSVLAHLTINDKKYTELYKIELLESLTPVNDFSMTETKTGSKSYDGEYVSGQRTDTSEDVYGQREDSTETVSGQRTDNSTQQVMAYNSTSFVDASKDINLKGSETDTSDYTKGEQTDNKEYVKGSQTNTEESDETESYTKSQTGYNKNPIETLLQYKDAWNGFSFYGIIFDDICKEFLLV